MIPLLAVLVLLAALGWRLWRPRAASATVVLVLLLPPVYAALVLWDAHERLDALDLRYVGKRVVWGPGVAVTGGGAATETAAVEDLHAELLGPGSLRFEPAAEGEAAAAAPGSEVWRPGTPLLRLSGVAPVVVVDDRIVNAVALEDGDVLAVERGAGARTLEIVFRDGALHGGVGDGDPRPSGWSVELPGALEGFLRPGRVAFLPDLLAEPLGEDAPALLSFLDRRDGRWHLVLRDESLRLRRGGEEVAALGDPRPLPGAFDLALQVVRGEAGDRRLRTVRQDRLRFLDDHAEIRFGRPERHRVPLGEVAGPLSLGVVVPSSSDRRPRLIELGEHSRRFHGLSATLGFEPATGEARLEYLGGAWTAEPGELYGLGEGDDLMLVRLERTRWPVQVPLELVALALFLLVFLGPSLRGSAALTAVAGTASLLLADRLLFAWRAATQPPDFFVRGYAEARLALWLVPALLLFGWTAGVVLRRLAARAAAEPRHATAPQAASPKGAPAAASAPAGAAPSGTGSPADGASAVARREAAAAPPPGTWRNELRRGASVLRWPVAGLLVAALACLFTVRGAGGELRALAFLPALLALLLPLLYVLAAGPLARRVGAWSGAGGAARGGSVRGAARGAATGDDAGGRGAVAGDGGGWRWPLWGLAAAGAAWLVLRLAFAGLGMPEALRLPGTGFRLLWTVVQLPLSALLVGLGAHAAREVARVGARAAGGGLSGASVEAPAGPVAFLAGVGSVAAYLLLAFAVVGLAVRDTGLLLVHGLATVLTLVLLLALPRPAPGVAREGGRAVAARAAAVVVALLPLLLVLAANLAPSRMVRLVDAVVPGGGADATVAGGSAGPGSALEVDAAERMRATTQQQLFRLYMLANPERLRDVGLKPAERVAVQYETLRAYAAAADLAGPGFHGSRLPRHLGVTYLNDLMPMAFVLADFGKLGMLALVLTYLAALLGAVAVFRGPEAGGDRWGAQGAWIATVALLAFALPGIYMTLANLNLVLFTGKNSSLLALNSVSDVLESGALLAVAAFGTALAALRPGRAA